VPAALPLPARLRSSPPAPLRRLLGTTSESLCASSGIGEASARGLAEQGATVAVAARRKDGMRLRATPPERGHGPTYQVT